MNDSCSVANRLARRDFLALTTAIAGGALSVTSVRADNSAAGKLKSPTNAEALGRMFIRWQSPVGGPDPKACPYRSQIPFNPGLLHGVAPATKALYRLFDVTGNVEFKTSADRYAGFMLATLHDPISPYSNLLELNGVKRNLMSAAWLNGKALSPCYELFVKHNPGEDAFELRAHG